VEVANREDIEVVLVHGAAEEIVLAADERDAFFALYPNLAFEARKGRGMWGASRFIVIDRQVVAETLKSLRPERGSPRD
jgi:hypothetical protein